MSAFSKVEMSALPGFGASCAELGDAHETSWDYDDAMRALWLYSLQWGVETSPTICCRGNASCLFAAHHRQNLPCVQCASLVLNHG